MQPHAVYMSAYLFALHFKHKSFSAARPSAVRPPKLCWGLAVQLHCMHFACIVLHCGAAGCVAMHCAIHGCIACRWRTVRVRLCGVGRCIVCAWSAGACVNTQRIRPHIMSWCNASMYALCHEHATTTHAKACGISHSRVCIVHRSGAMCILP